MLHVCFHFGHCVWRIYGYSNVNTRSHYIHVHIYTILCTSSEKESAVWQTAEGLGTGVVFADR